MLLVNSVLAAPGSAGLKSESANGFAPSLCSPSDNRYSFTLNRRLPSVSSSECRERVVKTFFDHGWTPIDTDFLTAKERRERKRIDFDSL